MSIFKKLLVILLMVALPPLIFISALDQRATQALSRDLIKDHRAAQVDQAANELGRLIDANNRLLARERELIEFALREQADNPWADLDSLRRSGGDLLLRRYAVYLGGTISSWPVGSTPIDPSGEAWFERASVSDTPIWTPRPGGLLTGAMAMRGNAGLAAIDVAADGVLERLSLPGEWTAAAAVVLMDQATGAVMARRGTFVALPPALLSDTSATATHEIDGRDMLIAHGPVGGYGLTMALVLPLDRILARSATSEERAAKRLERQATIGGTSVAVFAIVAIILSFIGSRAITRPVEELTRTARNVADGDLDARADVHTGDELEQLGRSFNAMVPKLQDRFRMREALSLAMEVQQHLLPEEPPAMAGFDIAGRSIYCDETGGDYYDFIEFSELDSHHVGVAVGDVTGHGVAAALLMTTARALLRSHAAQPGTLSQLMTAINQHLSEDTHAGRFMTLFYGVLEAPARTFRWVSAGHEPAILYNPESDSFIELPGHDIPLGIDGTWQYQEEIRDTWLPGEIVTIGTDGIWESRNPSGEMFGKQAMQAVIRKYADRPADEICDAIARTVRSFRQDQAQQDDITLVVIKALP